MKITMAPFYLLIMITILFAGCQQRSKHQPASNATAAVTSAQYAVNGKYVGIDTKETVVEWKGSMLIGTNSHTGYVSASKVRLLLDSCQLAGGTFEVDKNTIADEAHGRDNELVNHLKSPDFFDVIKFPFSTIAITRVEPGNGADKTVTANLTIKGITHPVVFPAKMEVKDGIIKANSKLVIDRTKWDVRYKSGKFYDQLADETLSDSIEFNIKIVAKK